LEDGRADEAAALVRECLTAAPEAAAGVLAGGLSGLGDHAWSLEDLTAREREVLACLADGKSNRQIAKSLDIAERTVTVHVSNVLRKTGAESRTEAALLAVGCGLAAPGKRPKPGRFKRG
ncbi:MAG: helix-turn-helix domain-containing protein, partial [Stackebrandtia sp.]